MTEALVLETNPKPGIAQITLHRPDARNAQNLALLQSLDAAFTRACQNTETRVIILAASGKDFSAGHDLKTTLADEESAHFLATGGNAFTEGDDGFAYMEKERQVFLDLCHRWRNLPLPTIAQVQGKCIAAGLMLAWVCDLIIAADDALFIDPVIAMGVSGVEWFAHPWELGHRKAKELLFTGDSWSAEEAHRLGMVNQVIPSAELAEATLQLAERIASKPAFALKAAKKAINGALDIQGQRNAIDTAFDIHHLCHYHNREHFGQMGDPAGLPKKKD